MSLHLVAVLGSQWGRKETIEKRGHQLPFFPQSPINHPWVLVNSHYHTKMERDWFDPRVKLVQDSGGFQMASLGVDVDPVEIMRLQNKMKADVAIGLDKIPIPRYEGEGTIRAGDISRRIIENQNTPLFEKCAEITREYMNKMIEVKEPGVNLYVPIHGHSYEARTRWKNIVCRDHDFDGFTSKSTTFSTAIEACAWMWDHGEQKPFHLLGLGQIERTGPFAYWTRHYKPQITADTTAWANASFFRMFFPNLYWNRIIMKSPNKTVEELRDPDRGMVWKYDRLPCDCEFCSQIPAEGITFDDNSWSILMSAHNLLMMRDVLKKLELHNLDPEVFKMVAKPLLRREESLGEEDWYAEDTRLDICDVVDALDEIPTKGGEAVVQKWCNRGREQMEAFF